MQIDVKGRNVSITPDLREHVEKRFATIAKQVSDLARLEVEIQHGRTSAYPNGMTIDATLYLKGVTLRARDEAPDALHGVNLCEEELARQVKRHRDKRRKRREARAASPRGSVQPAV